MMQRYYPYALGGFLFLLVFWLGVIAHFPEKALTQLIKSKTQSLSGVALGFSKANVGLFSVGFDTVRIQTTGTAGPTTLMSLKNVSIPFSLGLFSGVSVSSEVGQSGLLNGFFSWDGSSVTLEGKSIKLEDIPELGRAVDGQLKGRVTFNSQFSIPPKGGLPKGEIQGSLKNLEIDKLKMKGLTVPGIRLDQVEFKLKSSKKVEIKKFIFNGDLSGKLTGEISPQLRYLPKSRINLTFETSFKKEWLVGLGPLRFLLEGFMKNGKVKQEITGTLVQPRFGGGRGSRMAGSNKTGKTMPSEKPLRGVSEMEKRNQFKQGNLRRKRRMLNSGSPINALPKVRSGGFNR